MVNQMTGCVQNVKSFVEEHEEMIDYVCCDLTATVGKYPIPTDLSDYVDALWFGGHKIGTEGNIACIWISDRVFRLFGGRDDSRNEYQLLSGTPDVEGALMLAEATKFAVSHTAKMIAHCDYLTQALMEYLHSYHNIRYGIVLNSSLNKTSAINAFYLPQIDADALQMYLYTKNIIVGKGASACADEKDYRVLNAYGINDADANHVIRISFSLDNTIEDINGLVQAIADFKNIYC